jgi:hypothetical protein
VAIVLSVLGFTASDCPFVIFNIFLCYFFYILYKKSLKIPKGGNQNPYIEEEQTTQWPKEKYKRTNNDLQNIHIKLKIE